MLLKPRANKLYSLAHQNEYLIFTEGSAKERLVIGVRAKFGHRENCILGTDMRFASLENYPQCSFGPSLGYATGLYDFIRMFLKENLRILS
jgi:hypothetical protein